MLIGLGVYRVFTGKRGVELYEGQKKQRGVKSGADVVRVGSIVTLSAVVCLPGL